MKVCSRRRVRRFEVAHSASNHEQVFRIQIVTCCFGACSSRRCSKVESNKSNSSFTHLFAPSGEHMIGHKFQFSEHLLTSPSQV